MSFLLRNYMEVVVDEIIKDTQHDLKSCMCEQCMLDLKAIVLNQLPSKYVVTADGEMYMQVVDLMRQHKVDVLTAIMQADMLVSSRPHHAR